MSLHTRYLDNQTDAPTRGWIESRRAAGDTDKAIAESIIRVNLKTGVEQ